MDDGHGGQVGIKDYIDALLEERRNQVDAALRAMEKRLDGMNEFRAALENQGKTLLPRAEFEARMDAMKEDRTGAARYGITTVLAVVAVLASVGAIVALLLH